MKKAIVLKLLKIVVTILKRTCVQILTVSSNKYKKTSYRPTLLHQVQCSKGTKNRDRHTLSSILRPKGTIVFRALLQYSSLLRGSDGSVLSINVIEASLKKQLWLLLQKCSKSCCMHVSPAITFIIVPSKTEFVDSLTYVSFFTTVTT